MIDPQPPIASLEQRNRLLRAVRRFFHERDFIEVETPLLTSEIIPELHIDPIQIGSRFLQASPELYMKRLVAAGMSAIFQVCKCFRSGEHGPLHNSEFTMVEWYRTGDDMLSGMRLLDQLCQSVLKSPPATYTSYADAFQKHLGIDPHASTTDQLASCADALNLELPTSRLGDDRDEWLNALLAMRVEPQLGRDGPEILFDYPKSQAALAEAGAGDHGIEVAKRFELYWKGVELANGYQELTDGAELRTRLEAVNRQRQSDSRAPLPLPGTLLSAMENGLPRCAGCALGFDRLAMLASRNTSIDSVIAFRGD